MYYINIFVCVFGGRIYTNWNGPKTVMQQKIGRLDKNLQYARLDHVTAGPWYVVMRSTLKSYYTEMGDY